MNHLYDRFFEVEGFAKTCLDVLQATHVPDRNGVFVDWESDSCLHFR